MRRLAERGGSTFGSSPSPSARSLPVAARRPDLGPRGDRYLQAHAGVDGGLSIEDDWPREPYLLARFTKDVARHLAALKRVPIPDNLRAKRVRYSERALDRVRRTA